MVEVDDEDWLQKEVFDFDNVIITSNSPTINEVWTGNDDSEHEIFFGPVTHLEICAAKAVERLTPKSLPDQDKELTSNPLSASALSTLNKEQAILYSLSPYSFKQNNPIAVVHPLCKGDLESTERNENKENVPDTCSLTIEKADMLKNSLKKDKEMPNKDKEQSIERKKSYKSHLKAPSCLPSLLPQPGKSKLVPPKATAIKPLRATCPVVATRGSSDQSKQTTQLPSSISRQRVNSTPLSTAQTSNQPSSVGHKVKTQGIRQGATPSRRRSTSCTLRRLSSSTSKSVDDTSASNSVKACGLAPRSLLKHSETPASVSGKASGISRLPQKFSSSKPRVQGLQFPKSSSSVTSLSKNKSKQLSPSSDVVMETKVDTDINQVSEDKTCDDSCSPTQPNGDQGSSHMDETLDNRLESDPQVKCSGDPKSEVAMTTEPKQDQPISVTSIDDVLCVDEGAKSLSSPLIISTNQPAPEVSLLLDIDKAQTNSPLIKFSPPFDRVPLDPFATGSTPVQASEEATVLLPALAEEHPVNIDLIEF